MAEQGLEICRLCMEMGACVSIQQHYSRFPKPLPKMIDHCIGLTVSDNDLLPQNICNKCGQLLIIFYNYKNLCLESDTKFKALARASSGSGDFKNKTDDNITQETLMSTNQDNICVKNEIESSEDEQYDMDLDDINQPMDNDWDDNVDLKDDKLDQVPKPSSKEDAPINRGFGMSVLKPSLEDIQALKGIGVHVCKTCNLRLETWESVVTHIDRDTNCDVRIKCKLCLTTFLNMVSIQSHMELHKQQVAIIKKLNRKKDSTIFICDICDEEHTHKDALIRHLASHGIAVKLCNICNMCYNRIHRCMHKDFQCQQCLKKFGKLKSLKKHLQSHKVMATNSTPKKIF